MATDRGSLQLVVDNKPRKDLNKCIICQKKTNQGNTKLTSTSTGIQTLLECSNSLNDDLFYGVVDQKETKYHLRPCYSNYSLVLTY